MSFLKLILVSFFVFFIFVGCGTKRQYFEPKEVSYAISYDGYLPDYISDVSRGGATLKNGQIITKN